MSENKDTVQTAQTMRAYLNPLTFIAAISDFEKLQPLTAESVLEFLCKPGTDISLKAFVNRYEQISKNSPNVPLAPADERVLDKLIWPLRNAVASFMTENYLGTIALCGMVSEMVSILFFEMAEFSNGQGKTMDAKVQEKIFGSKFENLGQDRRVKVLEGYSLIDDSVKVHFETIRLTRKKYLHLWSQDHSILSDDAMKCYKSAAILVLTVLGLEFKGWSVVIDPRLEKYLQKSGIFERSPINSLPEEI